MNIPTKPGFTIWFTGLPASGKTSLAKAMQQLLSSEQIHCVVLDSDELRLILTPEPTYSNEERDWFYHVIAQFAGWLSKNGINVLISATANRRCYRDAARKQIARFAEVYVKCSLDICQLRDPKGIYAQSEQEEANTVPGVGTSYEPPIDPEVTVDTATLFPIEAAIYTFDQLNLLGILQPKLERPFYSLLAKRRVP